MKILVIDNYDSFTYNLVYILQRKGISVDVIRNDKIDPEQCLNYDGLILSPGPGVPKNAGQMMDIIENCKTKIPILGICLGHQAIAENLGGQLENMNEVFHGIQSDITQLKTDSSIFKGLSQTFKAGRYHSWIVSSTNLPPSIEITSVDKEQSIMSIQNKEMSLYGIQFHPESILSPEGHMIMQNFIEICKSFKS